MKRACLLFVVLASLVRGAFAHESRPAYLEIKETTPGRYDVLWRTPLLAGMRLPVLLKFPDDVRNVTEPTLRELPDSLIERRLIEAPGSGLAGKRIEFVGLQATIADVLVRMQMRDGTDSTTLVRPSQAWVEVGVSRGLLAVTGAYFKLGIEHILFGVDHLLFLLGLLLIVNDRWMLVKTISSFTVAHSITLAIATLGYARAPEPPLTAAIALSILFLGPEIVRSQRGETSLTIRHPWVVAFAFGLLHGFGFASGLTTMGLPRAELPLALLLFNLGVEAGQILFVIVVLLLERSFRVLEVRLPRLIEALPAYTVGSWGAFWTIQRVVIMLGGTR
jgi:hydrogenase/urease accessory protein HupE